MLWCVRDLAKQIVVCEDFIFVPRSIGVVVAMLLYSHCRLHAEWWAVISGKTGRQTTT